MKIFSNREATRTEWENNIQLHTKLAEKLLIESHESHFKINETILSTNQRALWEQAQTIDVSLMKKRTDVQEYIHALHTQLTLVNNNILLYNHKVLYVYHN